MPLCKARSSRAREKQVQKLPEPNFQFSPNDLPPIRMRDQLNARRGTNSKSRLSVTAESRQHEQNLCLPSSFPPPPAASGARGKLSISGGATRQKRAPRAPTEPQEPGNAQLVAEGQREQKGPNLGADLAPSKSCFVGNWDVQTSAQVKDAPPTPVYSLGGTEQRIQGKVGGSITPQAIISYPILKIPIYSK